MASSPLPEWTTRLGHLVTEKELRNLFDECDKDKNGTLDVQQFTQGLVGKYEIKWAQDPRSVSKMPRT